MRPVRLPLLWALLLLGVALPLPAAAGPTCVEPAGFVFCVDDPLEVDGGDIVIDNGVATASAEGGIVLGPSGTATILIDYTFSHVGMNPTLSYSFQAYAVLKTAPKGAAPADEIVASDGIGYGFSGSIGSAFQSGKLRLSTTREALAEGLILELWASESTWGPNGYQILGTGQSAAPVTLVTAGASAVPSANVQATATFDAGRATVAPTGATVTAHEGATVIVPGTAVKLVATGHLTRYAAPGMTFSSVQEYSGVWMTASVNGGPSYSVYRTLAASECWSGPCTLPGGVAETTATLVIPGSALTPRAEVHTAIGIDLYVSASGPGGSVFENRFNWDEGWNTFVLAGTNP